MAEQIKLDEAEQRLLREVGAREVHFTCGVYRFIRPGSRPVPGRQMQRLRALGLVVLARATPPVPPTRLCELTDAGRAVLDRLGGQG